MRLVNRILTLPPAPPRLSPPGGTREQHHPHPGFARRGPRPRLDGSGPRLLHQQAAASAPPRLLSRPHGSQRRDRPASTTSRRRTRKASSAPTCSPSSPSTRPSDLASTPNASPRPPPSSPSSRTRPTASSPASRTTTSASVLFAAYPDQIKLLVRNEPGYSYPSGHTTRSRLCALVLAQLIPQQRTQIIKIADTVGTDRILAGEHYLTDLEGGRTLGKILFYQLGKKSAVPGRAGRAPGRGMDAPAGPFRSPGRPASRWRARPCIVARKLCCGMTLKTADHSGSTVCFAWLKIVRRSSSRRSTTIQPYKPVRARQKPEARGAEFQPRFSELETALAQL